MLDCVCLVLYTATVVNNNSELAALYLDLLLKTRFLQMYFPWKWMLVANVLSVLMPLNL